MPIEMTIPPGLPVRTSTIDTDDPDDLSNAQPERRRSLVQLESGALRLRIREVAWGEAAIQSEFWSHALRVQQDRPSSYVAYAFITRGSARWMGVPIGPGSIVRTSQPWECVSEGPFEYVAFGVGRSAFESAALSVRDPNQPASPAEVRVGVRLDSAPLSMQLLSELNALLGPGSHTATRDATGEALLRLALLLDRPTNLVPVERLASRSARLAAIRKVDAYLEASGDDVPSIPTLCRISGVSERTLEYAFREHVGVTPTRYSRLRRLMSVHRKLQNTDMMGASVTEIVSGCGIPRARTLRRRVSRPFWRAPVPDARARVGGPSA